MAQRENQYLKVGKGLVMGNGKGMSKAYLPKVKICQQILHLSAQHISEAFQGITGKAQIEGIRSAMIKDLSDNHHPISSWREVAYRIQGLADEKNLE